MAAVNVTVVNVLNNPTLFKNPLQFEIQYECLYDLQDDLEWKVIYVGSAETEKYDQQLDSVLVGPVVPGNFRFVFQVEAPDWTKLPQDDIVGVTVVLLTCSYRGQEFIRVGYYVNNYYEDEQLQEEPPEKPIIDKLMRCIVADQPRVTKRPVDFDAPIEQIPTAGAQDPNNLAGGAGLQYPGVMPQDSQVQGQQYGAAFPAQPPMGGALPGQELQGMHPGQTMGQGFDQDMDGMED